MGKSVMKGTALLITLILAVLGFSAIKYSPEYMYRLLRYGESDTNDYKVFPERIISRGDQAYQYNKSIIEGLGEQVVNYKYKGEEYEKRLNDFLKDNQTTAFIVIHKDNIAFEQYYNGYTRDSINTSFSSAKSIVSLLIGIAIDEGYIKSEEQSIAEYIHEFKDTEFEEITIKDLLLMRSKISYKEGGLWLGDDAKTYYMPDLRKLAINNIKIDKDYKGGFHYNNYHPLLLGIILERSTGHSVSEFIEQKLWKKIGSEYDASWSLDSDKSGFEKMESGLNYRSIDFAKIGSMLLHNGKWNNQDVVSKDWINKSTIADFSMDEQGDENPFLRDKGLGYKYMWYSSKNSKGSYDYFAQGKYEQYLYLSPENNIVIIRNGTGGGDVDWWADVLKYVSNVVGDM